MTMTGEALFGRLRHKRRNKMKKPETFYFRLFSNYFHFNTTSVLHAPCDVKNFFLLAQKNAKIAAPFVVP